LFSVAALPPPTALSPPTSTSRTSTLKLSGEVLVVGVVVVADVFLHVQGRGSDGAHQYTRVLTGKRNTSQREEEEEAVMNDRRFNFSIALVCVCAFLGVNF